MMKDYCRYLSILWSGLLDYADWNGYIPFVDFDYRAEISMFGRHFKKILFSGKSFPIIGTVMVKAFNRPPYHQEYLHSVGLYK